MMPELMLVGKSEIPEGKKHIAFILPHLKHKHPWPVCKV